MAVKAASVNPEDLFAVLTGRSAIAAGTTTAVGGAAEPLRPPFVAGSDCVAVVMKTGQGVKGLSEGDWVVPARAGLGAWRSLAVWRDKDLFKIPTELLPVEYAAMMRTMCTAYRLLEDHGSLKPGDSVLLNAANSAVGTVVIQLCVMLKLRPVAVIREGPRFAAAAAALKALGAAEVLQDGGSLREALAAKGPLFARPRLGLDAVGGRASSRLAEALQEGSTLVVYGCMSGQSPLFDWDAWVFKDLIVRGFNLRRWVATHKKKVRPCLVVAPPQPRGWCCRNV